MKIVFRTDASLEIGTGHVMRCLTLAHELKRRGANVEFVCRKLEGNLCDFISGKGFIVHCLPTGIGENENYCQHAHWLRTHWQDDATQTLLYAKDADWLIVDHYAIDDRWENIIHPHVGKIMVIDDLADRFHKCELLLDQNYYSNADIRYTDMVEPGCQFLIGPKFALLRDEFAFARAKLRPRDGSINKILIFFGGVDANNDTGKAIEAIDTFMGEVIVVAGGSNKNFPTLERICSELKNFKLLRSVSNMAELFGEVDLAIGSGGSTSWERAALGLPTLAWPIAQNQVKLLMDLRDIGVIKLSAPNKLVNDILALTPDVMKEMSQKAIDICDAQGATRVANKIWSL